VSKFLRKLFSKDAKIVFKLAIPAALKHLVDILQMLVDMLMVGKISVNALAAVGISMQFMMILNVLMTPFLIGGNAIISRYIGEKKKDKASALLFTLIVLTVLLSLVVTVIGYFGSDYFYKIMGAQAEVVRLGSLYFRIITLGIVMIFFDALLYNSLSASGDTKTSFYVKLVSASLNGFLNYVLIFGNFGFPKMGIEGAAIATVISYTFNVFVYLILLQKKKSKLHIIPKFNLKDIKRVWNVGFSAGIDRMISSLSFIVFVGIITAYGTVELAGYQVGLRIEGIAFMPGFGFSVAAMALIGQNIGAKNRDRAYLMGIISGRIAAVFMGSVGIILILFPEFLISFFTKDLATIKVSSYYLILVGFAQVPLALVFVYSSALRVAGATKVTLKVNFLSLWFFRVIPSFIAYKLGFSIIAIFVIMNIETFIKGFIYYKIYKKREWLHLDV